MRHPGNQVLNWIFAVSFFLAPTCATAQGPTTPAIAPGSRTPPGNCGLVCEPKASLTLIAPSYVGSVGLLQNQPFVVTYIVTNKSLITLQGSVEVFGNGQPMPSLFGQLTLTLAPQQQFSGVVFTTNPPAGYFSI